MMNQFLEGLLTIVAGVGAIMTLALLLYVGEKVALWAAETWRDL